MSKNKWEIIIKLASELEDVIESLEDISIDCKDDCKVCNVSISKELKKNLANKIAIHIYNRFLNE